MGLGCLVCAAHTTPPPSPDPDVSMLELQSLMERTLGTAKQAAKWDETPRFLPQCWRRNEVLTPDHRGLAVLWPWQKPVAPNEERTVPFTRKIYIYHLCFAQERTSHEKGPS